MYSRSIGDVLFQKAPCNGGALFLSTGEFQTAVANHSIQALCDDVCGVRNIQVNEQAEVSEIFRGNLPGRDSTNLVS